MARYEVTREFIDSRTGKRVRPGETTEADEREAARMNAAGVLGRNLTDEQAKKKPAKASSEKEKGE